MSGDEKFIKLYTTYRRQMVDLCRKYVRSTCLAEDCVQEGFIKIYSKIDRVDMGRNPRSYIASTMVNHIRDEWKCAKVKLVLCEDLRTVCSINVVEEELRELDMDSARSVLSVDELRVFGAYVDGMMSQREIAARMGKRETTVRGIYRRAKTKVVDRAKRDLLIKK